MPVRYPNGAAQLECIKMKARLQKEMKRESEGEAVLEMQWLKWFLMQ